LSCGTFPHPPRLAPCVRLSPHTAQHLWSFSMDIHEASVPISPAPQCILRGQLARSLGTFVPIFPKARGLRHQSSSWCTWLSHAPTTMPQPTPHAALELRWALACLLPTLLRIRHEVSRVPYGGLKQDDVGGALSTVPSALCGSPDGAWGKSRFTHALFHWAYGVTQCRAYCCRHDSFCWSGWHHRQGMPGS
jgi:hypothetical protein